MVIRGIPGLVPTVSLVSGAGCPDLWLYGIGFEGRRRPVWGSESIFLDDYKGGFREGRYPLRPTETK